MIKVVRPVPSPEPDACMSGTIQQDVGKKEFSDQSDLKHSMA